MIWRRIGGSFASPIGALQFALALEVVLVIENVFLDRLIVNVEVMRFEDMVQVIVVMMVVLMVNTMHLVLD